MPHQAIRPTSGGTDLNVFVGKVFRWIALTIAVFLILFLVGKCNRDNRREKIVEAQKAKERAAGIGVMTIENAPTNRIGGTFYRLNKHGGWDSAEVRKVRSLEPNDFDVIVNDSFGHAVTFRWISGSGHWTGDNESNKLLHLKPAGTKASWSGLMMDTTKADAPIPIRFDFEVR